MSIRLYQRCALDLGSHHDELQQRFKGQHGTIVQIKSTRTVWAEAAANQACAHYTILVRFDAEDLSTVWCRPEEVRVLELASEGAAS